MDRLEFGTGFNREPDPLHRFTHQEWEKVVTDLVGFPPAFLRDSHDLRKTNPTSEEIYDTLKRSLLSKYKQHPERNHLQAYIDSFAVWDDVTDYFGWRTTSHDERERRIAEFIGPMRVHMLTGQLVPIVAENNEGGKPSLYLQTEGLSTADLHGIIPHLEQIGFSPLTQQDGPNGHRDVIFKHSTPSPPAPPDNRGYL